MNSHKEKIETITKGLGMTEYRDRAGRIVEGVYTLSGLHAPVDLNDCQPTKKAVLIEALKQLSKDVDEAYQCGIERNLAD